jgi:AcrR family transcriptional regulator
LGWLIDLDGSKKIQNFNSVSLYHSKTNRMGIKERRQREIETVKAAILEAARKLAIAEGWPKVSIRKIANAIEFTPPVIYEHYKNKEAILIELEDIGFRQLRYALEEARAETTDPAEQLIRMSETYWEWAFQQGELYQVMFNLEGIRSTPPTSTALRESGKPVIKTLQQLHLFQAEVEELFFNWWGLVHGHVSIVMSQQVSGMQHQLRRYLLAGVRRFIQGMTQG